MAVQNNESKKTRKTTQTRTRNTTQSKGTPNKAQARARRSRVEQRRRRLIWRRRIVLAGLALCLIFILFVASRIKLLLQAHAYITMTAENVEMIQGNALPELPITVEMKDKRKAVLNKKEGYSAENLKNDLIAGKDYTIDCGTDGNTDGDFTIKIVLSDELQQKLDKEWKHRVKIKLEDGTLYVKNKVGQWDGEKFKTWSGEYVSNQLVSYHGKAYLFDESGELMHGLQTYKGATYYFSKKTGASATSRWAEIDGNKYYFGKDSKAKTGFVKTKKGTYYFDSTGVMQTGDISVGLLHCVIGEDGIVTTMDDSYVDPNKPMVALTFDDGPGDRTMELLECLEKYHAHATFFMVGQNVGGNKEAVKKMTEIGCELGNHTWNHANLSQLSSGGISDTIGKTNDAIKKASGGPEVTVVRPPYGAVNDTVRASVNYPIIYWNIDTLDWKTRNAKKTVDLVMGKADNGGRDGDIILMHDIHTESIDAALELILKLTDAGYQLVTVTEMAEAKEKPMSKGTIYYDFCDSNSDDSEE